MEEKAYIFFKFHYCASSKILKYIQWKITPFLPQLSPLSNFLKEQYDETMLNSTFKIKGISL